jgi:hypothetical protein
MPNDETQEVILRAMRGDLSRRELAMIGLASDTKAVVDRIIELSPALEGAVLELVDLVYRDGISTDMKAWAEGRGLLAELVAQHLEPEPEDDDMGSCPICHKIHTIGEITNLGIDIGSLIPGHEYVINTKTNQQKYPRVWRMGFLGANGYQLEFSARGPDRTHARQYGGTQNLDRRQITGVREVERDDRKRHVGKLAL